MLPVDALLLAFSLFIVILILFAEARRGRGKASARLSPRMLFIRISLGLVFAVLGVIGSILPIMQGWVFFLLSALILFPQSRFAIKAVDRIEAKAPRLVRWLRRMGVGIHRDDAARS